MPYTEKQVAALQNAAQQFGTLNGEIAGQLADELGLTKRSVIAKIKSLGLDYAVAKKPVKGTRAISKAEYVSAIAKALDADASTLDGLEKATAFLSLACWRLSDDSRARRLDRCRLHDGGPFHHRHERGKISCDCRVGIINIASDCK